MEQDGFHVFTKEYRLNRLQKAGHVVAQLLALLTAQRIVRAEYRDKNLVQG